MASPPPGSRAPRALPYPRLPPKSEKPGAHAAGLAESGPWATPSPTWSDPAVVRLVLSGERNAFGILVERYEERLLAYAVYMGLGMAEAHDVVQDGFIRAFIHLDQCGDPERFDGWLFTIVSNLCRTALTSRARRDTMPIDLFRNALVDDTPGPDEVALAQVRRARVRQALEAVPTDQREALVLRYLQGFSVRAIAGVAGASESAVKMRLKRGRETLRRAFGPEHTPSPDATSR